MTVCELRDAEDGNNVVSDDACEVPDEVGAAEVGTLCVLLVQTDGTELASTRELGVAKMDETGEGDEAVSINVDIDELTRGDDGCAVGDELVAIKFSLLY